MVLDELTRRLTGLFRRTDEHGATDGEGNEPAERERTAGSDAARYAEEVEYGVDERELPDEDKLLRLLVERGGRVDQSTVLDRTGWSEEHLATVVDRMEDDNQVSAIVVGRKRVICRRGFEPKGYRSHLTE